MSTLQKRRFVALGGFVGLLIAVIVVFASGDDRYMVKAQFTNVAGLRPGTDVRVGRVKVGTVKSLTLGDKDIVTATLALDAGVAPVGRDASAYVRSLNLLGGKYVDLSQGDVERSAAPSGWTIPPARTGSPVALDDVLDVLDADTRDRLRVLLSETGIALDGRGQDLSALLRTLPPTLDQTSALINGLASDNHALGQLLEQSNTFLGTVSPQRAALGELVDSAQHTLAVTASRSARLGETLRDAPATLTQLRRTLVQLDRTAVPLRPAARSLQQSAEPLTGVLEQAQTAKPQLLTTLAKLRTVAPTLAALGKQVTPLVRRLKPSAALLSKVSRQSAPLMSTVDSSAPELLQVLEGWARAIQTRDASGHLFRGQLVLSNDLAKALTNYIASPTVGQGASVQQDRTGDAPATSASRPGTTASTPTSPPARELATKALDDLLHKIVPGLPTPTPAPVSGSGGTKGLLDFLLKP
ncbi:MAG: Mammalian cell entry related domain protein [Solirubrobacterales bacterium]|nr:Mammalian cell entry related domain protein [Solirubrobacterales bacterium]